MGSDTILTRRLRRPGKVTVPEPSLVMVVGGLAVGGAVSEEVEQSAGPIAGGAWYTWEVKEASLMRLRCTKLSLPSCRLSLTLCSPRISITV